MRTQVRRYVNEVVSLSILSLMAIALIAGQADATVHERARADASMSSKPTSFTPLLDALALIEIESAALSLRIDVNSAEVAVSFPVEAATEPADDVAGIKFQSGP